MDRNSHRGKPQACTLREQLCPMRTNRWKSLKFQVRLRKGHLWRGSACKLEISRRSRTATAHQPETQAIAGTAHPADAWATNDLTKYTQYGYIRSLATCMCADRSMLGAGLVDLEGDWGHPVQVHGQSVEGRRHKRLASSPSNFGEAHRSSNKD